MSNRTARKGKSGSATVEFALVLPVFVLLLLGTIEVCRAIYLRQAAKISAYEAARVALVPGATMADLELQCDGILSSRKIQGYVIETSMPLSSLRGGNLLTVDVSMPFADNSILSPYFFRDSIISESVTVLVEDL